MTSKLVSAFECIIESNVDELAGEDRQEAYRILVEESFNDFLEYLEDKGSISTSIREFLSFDMFLYEVDTKTGAYLNYYEEDFDKRTKLIEKVFDGQVDDYAENYTEEE